MAYRTFDSMSSSLPTADHLGSGCSDGSGLNVQRVSGLKSRIRFAWSLSSVKPRLEVGAGTQLTNGTT
jgi:hypothetical protein